MFGNALGSQTTGVPKELSQIIVGVEVFPILEEGGVVWRVSMFTIGGEDKKLLTLRERIKIAVIEEGIVHRVAIKELEGEAWRGRRTVGVVNIICRHGQGF